MKVGKIRMKDQDREKKIYKLIKEIQEEGLEGTKTAMKCYGILSNEFAYDSLNHKLNEVEKLIDKYLSEKNQSV